MLASYAEDKNLVLFSPTSPTQAHFLFSHAPPAKMVTVQCKEHVAVHTGAVV